LLIDDVDIDRRELRQFIEIIENYNYDPRHLFPLFWIPDPDISQRPKNCVVFNFPPASRTVLKRVIKKVSNAEGLRLSKQQIDELTLDNPGDVRLAVNQLQLTGSFSLGSYQMLTFFQAVGEILYNKKRISSEEILHVSHCSPKMIVNSLFENYQDFLGSVDDIADAAEYLSEADILMAASWNHPELGDVAATTTMRGLIVANRNPHPTTFWSLRESRMGRLRPNSVDPEAPFLCWPNAEMTAGEMDSRLFTELDNLTWTKKSDRETEEVNSGRLEISEQELLEALRMLEIDPIED
jgi:hypothetical protein